MKIILILVFLNPSHSKTSRLTKCDTLPVLLKSYFGLSNFLMSNRDIQQNNKTKKAVQAYLYGKITHDIVHTVMNNNKTSDEIGSKDMNSDRLLNLVLQSNQKMTNYFGESQSDMNKLICAKYADGQHSKISRAITNNEDVFRVDGVSPYVVTNELLSIYEEYNNLMHNGTYHFFHSLCTLSDMV